MAVKYEDQEKVLPLVIAKGDRTSLFGRSWMRSVTLNWQNIFSVKVSCIDEMLKKCFHRRNWTHDGVPSSHRAQGGSYSQVP